MKTITRLSLLFLVAMVLFAAIPALAQDDARVCEVEAARQEKAQAIPDRLLHAISLMESGRWDAERKANLAWPWTVMAEGEGRFLPSKQAAIAEVNKLHARGVRNIDVGCMQINLVAHPDAFATLDEAFDPRSNVAYAARFLNELHSQDGNWAMAGGHYHSQTPDLARPYQAKLVQLWDGAKRGPAANEPVIQLAAFEFRQPLGLSIQPAAPVHAAEKSPAPASAPDLDKAAAKRAADSYRLAKLAEYRQKHPLS